MAAAKPEKPGVGRRARHGKSIPEGNAQLPGATTEDLRRMHAGLSGRREIHREALVIATATKWGEGLIVSEIAGRLQQPRSTVHDWPARLRNRGLEGIPDRTAPPNREPVPCDVHRVVIVVWRSRVLQAYGFESGPWQTSILRRMVPDRPRIDIRPGTPRATLRRMNLSFRCPGRCRTGPQTQMGMDAPTKAECVNSSEDGMTAYCCPPGRAWDGCGRGGRQTARTTIPAGSLKVSGALGGSVLHLKPASSTKSMAFRAFL